MLARQTTYREQSLFGILKIRGVERHLIETGLDLLHSAVQFCQSSRKPSQSTIQPTLSAIRGTIQPLHCIRYLPLCTLFSQRRMGPRHIIPDPFRRLHHSPFRVQFDLFARRCGQGF